MPTIDDIIDDFLLLDDWNDRYGHLIELGRKLEPLPPEAHNEVNRVRGCASQVWLKTTVENRDGEPRLSFKGDSDAFIVKGLIYLVFALYSGRPATDIASTDALPVFAQLGLAEHLTPQRSNGLRAMVDRVRSDARDVADGRAPASQATEAGR